MDLATASGLAVNRGILVDDRMQASDPNVFAAGDVAEHNGLVLGLWPIAAKQAEVAAANALGGEERLVAELPATILKGVGLELSAVGRVEPKPGEEVILVEDAGQRSYRKLVLAERQVVGAVILGHHPESLTAATTAVKRELVLDDAARAAVQAGDWSVLAAARPADVATATV
jgi:NAD(P)H-nitrite reductase large subunit